uniref:Uncharacterized protein n=1 Tax=Pithovirus LCPAC103 TaxID=2506588 RepID=A0A481Z3E7_9VIRU|nr:MAG: hypothetical protein LCPAC103_00550 [Pithovirus LCPAC103]
MTDPVVKVIVLCASDPKSLSLIKLVQNSNSDVFHVININNPRTLYQLRHTQTSLQITSLPALITRFTSGRNALMPVELLPQLLATISGTHLKEI